MTTPQDPAGWSDPVVDARGTRCPQPVILAARAARQLGPGSVLVLLADDEAARSDVPAWARLRGHAVTTTDEDGWTAYRVVVGAGPAQGVRST